jgi:hypothetical protein
MDKGRSSGCRSWRKITAGAKKGDYNSITQLAKQFIDEIKKARNQK